MRFLRSPLGAITILLLLVASGFVASLTLQIASLTSPRRGSAGDPLDLLALFPDLRSVRFAAADGVPLEAWLLPGIPGQPAVILCHDIGADKSALTHLAAVLGRQGLTVLALDFRGHGGSGGGRSTLGLDEKRDVLAALDFLSKGEADPRRMGIYGVGMGAHAAALAARDRPVLKVLVLDGLYPDVGYALAQGVYTNWGFARRNLAFLPAGIFAVLNGTSPYKQRASDALAGLAGRDVLFLAPQRDTGLVEAMTRMYEAIPAQADADGNIEFLEATHAEGLYGAELDAYHEQVGNFFKSRLRAP